MFWPHPPHPRTPGPVFKSWRLRQGCSQHTLVGSEEGLSPTPLHPTARWPRKPSEQDGMLNTSARDIRPERTARERGADSAGRPRLRADCGLDAGPCGRGGQSCDVGRWTGRAPRAGLALSCCLYFHLHPDKPRPASWVIRARLGASLDVRFMPDPPVGPLGTKPTANLRIQTASGAAAQLRQMVTVRCSLLKAATFRRRLCPQRQAGCKRLTQAAGNRTSVGLPGLQCEETVPSTFKNI